MKATLMLLGASLLAPLAGGFAGAAINTVPLTAAGDPLATIPRHESDFTGNIAFGGYDIPDHYPLVTRHGTIPVEELVFHGRLRGRSGDPYAGQAADAAAEPAGQPAPAAADRFAAPPDDGALQRAADIARLVSAAPPQAALPAVPLEPVAQHGLVQPAASRQE